MLAKAATIAADEIVLDLEDAVAVAAKDEARDAAVTALRGSRWSCGSVAVRVNAPGTPWCHLDLAALAALPDRPGSIVVPKVEGAADLHFVDRLLDGAEAPARLRPIRIQALIETPAGLARVAEIAASSPRLDALIIGYADLGAALGRADTARDDGPDTWASTRDAVLLAARVNGLQAIDGPYLGTKPDERFRASAGEASRLGFDGKWAIHPSQVASLVESFTPAPEEIERARAVVDALDQAERAGAGAVALDGEMLDEAVRVRALRLLSRAGVEVRA